MLVNKTSLKTYLLYYYLTIKMWAHQGLMILSEIRQFSKIPALDKH